ncbi:Acetolactate synthase isozyme 3 large subunit [Serratia marcescens]|nr:Acetolactate synthase isozyme 3 large subunit [Serratia marcescens]CAI1856865.1 Acetolactate synthase isozyme 3 large subunit [Serratia marcescens]
MEMLSGAEMVVRSLIDQGVKHVFGYPGGAVLDIYDALHTVGGIDHILVRHEQGRCTWPTATRAPPVKWAWCW